MAWKKILRLLFTIGATGAGIGFLHHFIANGKDGDDILNVYALILVLLSFLLSNKKGKNIDSVKDVTDVVSVMVALAVTYELVFGKKSLIDDPFNIIKWLEIILCIAIVIFGVIKGGFIKKINKDNAQQPIPSEDLKISNFAEDKIVDIDDSNFKSVEIEKKKNISTEEVLESKRNLEENIIKKP